MIVGLESSEGCGRLANKVGMLREGGRYSEESDAQGLSCGRHGTFQNKRSFSVCQWQVHKLSITACCHT